MKFVTLALLCTIFVVSQQNEPSANTIVATLFKQNIYLKDIDVSAADKEQSKKDFAEDVNEYQKWLWEVRGQNLSPKIIGAMFNKYVVDNKLQATDTDVEAFFVDNKLRQQREQKHLNAQKQQLLEKLKTAQGKEKKQIEFDLENINYEIQVQNTKPSKWIATSFIRSWKMNNALYKKYGGRVIFQQMGPEPLDAYRKFLQDCEKRGDFQIMEEKLKLPFWEYFVNEKMHRFYSQKEGNKVMTTPWWK